MKPILLIFTLRVTDNPKKKEGRGAAVSYSVQYHQQSFLMKKSSKQAYAFYEHNKFSPIFLRVFLWGFLAFFLNQKLVKVVKVELYMACILLSVYLSGQYGILEY